MHSVCTESFAVCMTAVTLKHIVYDDGGLYNCSMLVAVYYQTYCIKTHSVSLTGIPVLHTVSTHRIAVGRTY